MSDDKSTRLTRRHALALSGAALGGVALGNNVLAQTDEEGEGEGEDQEGEGQEGAMRRYRVTVANLTGGQPFTPPAVALHSPEVEAFSVGEQASDAIQALAENGNLQPLASALQESDAVGALATGDAPLVPQQDPGGTGNPYFTSLELEASESATHLTFLSMLIATNDGFTGLDTVELPEEPNASETYYASAYDAGTERNTEQFSDMVPAARELIIGEGGAQTGTTESNPDLAETDVIRPHPGIQGTGDLSPQTYDWSGPVALVQVENLGAAEEEAEETPAEGNMTETPADGNMTETPAEGNMTETPADGNMTETPAEGNMTDGNMTETPAEGNMTDGNMTGTPMEGNMTDGNATGGNETG
jgi:hypothetical protein